MQTGYCGHMTDAEPVQGGFGRAIQAGFVPQQHGTQQTSLLFWQSHPDFGADPVRIRPDAPHQRRFLYL